MDSYNDADVDDYSTQVGKKPQLRGIPGLGHYKLSFLLDKSRETLPLIEIMREIVCVFLVRKIFCTCVLKFLVYRAQANLVPESKIFGMLCVLLKYVHLMNDDQGSSPVSGHRIHCYFLLISVFCDGCFLLVCLEKVRIILEGDMNEFFTCLG